MRNILAQGEGPIYIHAADIWIPFGKPQIIGTNEEALYIVDALCHHESDLHIQEHYTDTGGASDQVFALTALLGFVLLRVFAMRSHVISIC
ncbi:MAG: hypothetical protein NVSMB49_17210 [Ktedonobacteraceae bacterium]